MKPILHKLNADFKKHKGDHLIYKTFSNAIIPKLRNKIPMFVNDANVSSICTFQVHIQVEDLC